MQYYVNRKSIIIFILIILTICNASCQPRSGIKEVLVTKIVQTHITETKPYALPTNTPSPTSSPIPTITSIPTNTNKSKLTNTKTSTPSYTTTDTDTTTATPTPTPTPTKEVISFPFNIDSGKHWRYVSDRVMGGVSNGQVSLEQNGEEIYARLTGNVSTRNNGGFIQLNSSSSLYNDPLLIQSVRNSEKDGKRLQGVRLKVRGNGEIYYIFIQTNEIRSVSDYYQSSFVANADWEMIYLPFNKFIRKRSDVIIDTKLEAKSIRSFGIMAYGRDFIADLSVSTVDFYY